MLRARSTLSSAALALAACACAALPPAGEGRRWIAVDARAGRTVDLDAMARSLAACDVVFLGEEHDSDAGHALQLELTRRLLDLRPVASLSFEMIERDAQPALDRWLAGEISEGEFLADTRPWPNWRRHYRPLALLAKERGLPVVAANIPRPLASRVSHHGLESVAGESHVPRDVIAPRGAYWERFARVMDREPELRDPAFDLWYLAQCIKDEAMAESIERAACAPPAPRLVVHYCGHFHSDYRLGTVERLLRRQPGLKVGVVTMRSTEGELEQVPLDVLRAADFVWQVRE